MSKEIEKMTAIYEKHKNTMYAVALKILKNPQDAEDAVPPDYAKFRCDKRC